VHNRFHQVELQTNVHLHSSLFCWALVFLLLFLRAVHELVLENSLVVNYTLFSQELVHLHFHLRELLALGQQLWLWSFLDEADQQVDVLAKLLGVERHSQIDQQLLVDHLGNLENRGANVGWFL
jgi:hypothetical protein